MRHHLPLAAALAFALAAPAAVAQSPALSIKPLAERRVEALPPGTLFWRIENFASVEQAQSAAGPHALVAQAAGKVWLFSLGADPSAASPGGTRVGQVGPIPRIEAARYLLRINEASGPPGAVTAIHSHPGSEAFFVLSGQQSIRSARGVMRVNPGEAEAGQGAGMAMQVSSSGSAELQALVMFVVDADKPFSTPAALP